MSQLGFRNRRSPKLLSSNESEIATRLSFAAVPPALSAVSDDTRDICSDCPIPDVSPLRITSAVKSPSPLPYKPIEDYACKRQHSHFFAVKVDAKCFLLRRLCSAKRLGLRIRELRIGNTSLSVSMLTGQMEDSCYVEYITCEKRWRASYRPSGVVLRIVDTEELSDHCRKLVTFAGCVFKTSSDTVMQKDSPVEIPARMLRSMFESLGFYCVEKEPLYRVYAPRTRRRNRAAVSIVPFVDAHGRNRANAIVDDGHMLLAYVEVFRSERVAMIVESLRERSKDSLITMRGREIVESKFRGFNSIVLM